MASLNRRDFIKILGLSAGISAIPGASRLLAFTNMRYSPQGFDDQYGRAPIVAGAMNFLASRFGTPGVLTDAYERSGDAYHIAGGYWESCRMNQQNVIGYKDLLRYQVSRLAASVPFPNIRIRSFHEESEAWGKADVGRLKVYWSRGIDWKGDFDVQLNTYHLGSSGTGSNPEIWASVIAHEMLHNLGHMHKECDGSLQVQMNSFAHSIYAYGKSNWAVLIPRCI